MQLSTRTALPVLCSLPVARTFVWQSIGFFGFYGLRAMGIDHVHQPMLFCTYALVVIAMMLATNPDIVRYMQRIVDKRSLMALSAILLLAIVAHGIFSPDTSAYQHIPHVEFAFFEGSYVVSRSVDIMFQQIAFTMWVQDMLVRQIPMWKIQAWSSALLAGSHTLTLTILPWQIALIFIGASAIAGQLFPLLLRNPRGFFGACALHWGFYLTLGVLFNLYFGAL